MRRVTVVVAVLAVALIGGGTAAAKPIVYPVKLAPIKVKSTELPPDSKWWHFPGVTAETPIIVTSGRVVSPKPACRRKQPIRVIYEPPYGAASEDKSTDVVSDATGRWEGEPVPDFGFTEAIRSGEARFWVRVVRKRLGKGRFCAEAVSDPLNVGPRPSARLAMQTPHGKPAKPRDTLTLKFKLEELPPLVEQPPVFGRAYYGTLTTVRAACRAGRPVWAIYEFPSEPPGTDPLIRPMWGGGEGAIKTDGSGAWEAEPVIFVGMALRVRAFVKAKPAGAKPCPRVESKPLVLPPQYPPSG
jgi:hypothetical protein